VDLGAQRIGGEVLFPQAWSEFLDGRGGHQEGLAKVHLGNGSGSGAKRSLF
jgi:hypothetical protein